MQEGVQKFGVHLLQGRQPPGLVRGRHGNVSVARWHVGHAQGRQDPDLPGGDDAEVQEQDFLDRLVGIFFNFLC